MISLLIYSWLLLKDILLRFISLYNCYLFCIEYFLFSMYFLIMKFFVAPESIIMLSAFSLILIFIYNWAVLIEAAFLLAEAVPQYFFWLFLSEKSSSFSGFLKDIFFGCIINCPSRILYIFYACSRSRSYLLCKITIMFICNL